MMDRDDEVALLFALQIMGMDGDLTLTEMEDGKVVKTKQYKAKLRTKQRDHHLWFGLIIISIIALVILGCVYIPQK